MFLIHSIYWNSYTCPCSFSILNYLTQIPELLCTVKLILIQNARKKLHIGTALDIFLSIKQVHTLRPTELLQDFLAKNILHSFD